MSTNFNVYGSNAVKCLENIGILIVAVTLGDLNKALKDLVTVMTDQENEFTEIGEK